LHEDRPVLVPALSAIAPFVVMLVAVAIMARGLTDGGRVDD
jgi:hypothetical protein